MKTNRPTRKPIQLRYMLVALAVALIATVALSAFPPVTAMANSTVVKLVAAIDPEAVNGNYVVVSWNDLGMHCMNQFFKVMAVLPPYNTVWAQVVKRGREPQVVTTNIKVTYKIRGNTYSVGKSDFWTYAPKLFGVTLAPNVGLTGKKLADKMDPKGDHFVAEGIPLTPFLDSAPTQLYPYQLVDVTAKDATTGAVLAQTTTVAPVSTEMHCDYCHASGKNPGGSYADPAKNILAIHDRKEGTTLINQQPVMCARCHSDNALGAPGAAGVESLSQAMHQRHANASFISKPACYDCHPGPQTKCLRDVMYKEGKTCTDCHGTMKQVADPTRRPWIDEPKCGSCHESKYAENPGKRYRDSVGHGGLYCETCHGSPHAILATTQPNDNIQNIQLQGEAGTLKKCSVCHTTTPDGPGPHEGGGD